MVKDCRKNSAQEELAAEAEGSQDRNGRILPV